MGRQNNNKTKRQKCSIKSQALEWERGKGETETAYQSELAEAAEDWVAGAVSSPKKFDSDEDVTRPASIALTLEESK